MIAFLTKIIGALRDYLEFWPVYVLRGELTEEGSLGSASMKCHEVKFHGGGSFSWVKELCIFLLCVVKWCS